MQGWSYSSSSSCQGTSQKVVQTTYKNGQTIVTTTYTGGTPSCSVSGPQQVQQISSTPNQVQTAPTPTNASTGSFDSFEVECLDEHNRYRALHGCPPLKLNRKLCSYATDWAKTLAAKNNMQHRTTRTYGENLFMASGCNVDGKMAVKNWYNEIAQYNYSRPGFHSATGHFTQVVWKNSKELGVGVAKRGSSTWVVANYDPAGNFANDFGNNVPMKR